MLRTIFRLVDRKPESCAMEAARSEARLRANAVPLAHASLLVVLLAVTCCGPLSLLAAEPQVLLEDDFSTLYASLGSSSNELRVKDNTLQYSIKSGYLWRSFYEGLFFENADIRMRVRLPDPSAEQGAVLGVMFWGAGLNDFYLLAISDSGTFAVLQRGEQGFIPRLNWRDSDAIHRQPGEWNELRVVVSGSRADLWINGKQVGKIRGKPPEGGSMIGPYLQSGSADVQGEFSQVKVLEGPAPDPQQLEEDASLLLSDDFSTLDPAWGTESSELTVRDNALQYRLPAGYSWRSTYGSQQFPNAATTLRVRLPDFGAEQGGAIGLMFWSKSHEEHYLFEISDAGTFAIFRRLGGRWLVPVRWRDSDAVRKEIGAWNELRVVTVGRRAICSINGKEVATLHGQPTADSSHIGLYLESGKVELLGEFSQLQVHRVPESPANDEDQQWLMADDFQEWDAAWGVEQPWYGIRDGHLFIDFQPNESYHTFYQGALFGDMELSCKLRCLGADDSESATGVVFWGEGPESYYTVTLYRNGTISLARFVNKKWVYPMTARGLPPEAKFDPNGWTNVRLQLVGRKAILAVNGIEIGAIPGQPPQQGALLGVYGHATQKPAQSQLSELRVRQTPTP